MRKNKRRLLRVVLVLSALLLILLLPLCSRLRQRVRSAAEDHARLLAQRIVTEAAAQCAREGFFSYDALIRTQYDSEGRILALSTDAAMLNLLTDALMRRVQEGLEREELCSTSFPLGSVLGSDLFSALGPDIPLRLKSRNTLSAEPLHTLEEAGVNQSLHTLTLRVQGTITVLLYSGELTVEICRDVPVCQTLLLGKVPPYTHF